MGQTSPVGDIPDWIAERVPEGTQARRTLLAQYVPELARHGLTLDSLKLHGPRLVMTTKGQVASAHIRPEDEPQGLLNAVREILQTLDGPRGIDPPQPQ